MNAEMHHRIREKTMNIKSVFRILTAPVIISALIIYIAFYSVGVVEKNLAAENAKEYISSLVTDIYEGSSEYEELTSGLCSEYELKAKTLSVLISQLPVTLSEDMTSEELRIASGADKIMISDKYGKIIFSTSPDENETYTDERFKDGLSQSNYCSTVINKSEGGCTFDVAVSRRNEGGLIIASFENSAFNEVLNYNGSAYAIHRSSSFNAGVTAVIDLESNTFAAHTNAGLVGSDCIIPSERFKNTSGYFSYRYQHEPSFVFYEFYDDSTVIISIISKEYVYTKRTLVLVWMIVLDFNVILAFALALRTHIRNNS